MLNPQSNPYLILKIFLNAGLRMTIKNIIKNIFLNQKLINFQRFCWEVISTIFFHLTFKLFFIASQRFVLTRSLLPYNPFPSPFLSLCCQDSFAHPDRDWGPVKNHPRCGISAVKRSIAQRRIVGGDEAGFGTFPWQAYIRIGTSRWGGNPILKQNSY